MVKTVIEQLWDLGQSVWLDYISRSLIESGQLKEMLQWGLRGMTSNPTIFDHAISSGTEYETQLRELHKMRKSTFEIYDDLSIKDIQDAADIFKPIHDSSNGLDGYVSLEINPKLAYQTKATIEEGIRLAHKVNRANVMFKVPATQAGYEAIATLLAKGINVNVTLIFSLDQYRKTAEAYLKGIHAFVQNNGDARAVRSVASVFVSRVDTAVDKLLDHRVEKEQSQSAIADLLSLKGMAAVANANLIYREYSTIFSGDSFKQLEANGVNVQRLLWGSTGTKNPDYSDIKYVTELIGTNTVNTLPEHTIAAFLDHGSPEIVLTENTHEAERILASLQQVGIDIHAVCAKLLDDGVVAFEKSFESLLDTIERSGTKV